MQQRAFCQVLLAGLLSLGVAAQARIEKKLEPTFKPGGHIHGYLVDQSGRGLTGMLALCTPDGRKLSYHHTEAMRRGRFDIDNLEPGTYRLHVDTLGNSIENLAPPEDVTVEVRRKKIVRPRLVARPGDHVSPPTAAGVEK
jgi:hypothetical protein